MAKHEERILEALISATAAGEQRLSPQALEQMAANIAKALAPAPAPAPAPAGPGSGKSKKDGKDGKDGKDEKGEKGTKARVACTLGEAADATAALKELANHAMAVAPATKIVKLSRWGAPHLHRFAKAREELLKKHGRPANEGTWEVPHANAERFLQELNGTRAEVLYMDEALKFSLAELGDLKLTPATLEHLSPFLTSLDD